jgi:universal stress protein A
MAMDNQEKGAEETTAPGAIEPLRAQRILAPSDMSDLSKKSVLYALRLAAALKAEIIALHVYDVFVNPPDGTIDIGVISSGEIEGWRQDVKREFDQYLDQLAEMPENLIRVLRSSQDRWKEITAVAEEMAVDLIVISTHGRSGLEHLVRGSDAEKIIREAPCPVLVVRSH